jgi:hypothetical protein
LTVRKELIGEMTVEQGPLATRVKPSQKGYTSRQLVGDENIGLQFVQLLTPDRDCKDEVYLTKNCEEDVEAV